MNNLTRLLYSFFIACFVLLSSGLSSQDVVSITDEDINELSCAATIILTDSDSDNGNYSPGDMDVITICTEAAATTEAQITISPDLFGDTWDVDSESEIIIYDGDNIGATIIGSYNTTSHPAGVNVTGSSNCLTIEFIAGPASSGAGFTATVGCVQPLQPFDFTFSTTPEAEQIGDLPAVSVPICFTQEVEINVETNYALSDAGGNGYEQADATSFFEYTMGDGTIYSGPGLTQITHTYDDPFGFLVIVKITDVLGRVETRELFVLTAPMPMFDNPVDESILCIGEETTIDGGLDAEGNVVGAEPSENSILGGGILGEQLFLPDGDDENYETIITVDDFPEGLQITSLDDFVNFCVTMEHSYLGDLEMMLSCPNGTSINIFNSYNGGTDPGQLFPQGFGGGGTFLGQPLDTDNQATVPGIGYTYCFFDDAELGTLGDEFGTNTVPVTDPSPGNSVAPGTYLPEESFENFIGCPINGDWTLTIRDNLFSDNGYIFNWSIFFNPEIDPNTLFYSPQIDSVYWSPNDDIISGLDGDEIVVQPSNPGPNEFIFNAIDEFGCLHSTPVDVTIRPEVVMEADTVCGIEHILAVQNAPAGGVFETIDAPTDFPDLIAPDMEPATGFSTINVANLSDGVPATGVYEIQFTDANCGYQDEAIIDFRPIPELTLVVPDTVLCEGASILLDAGEPGPNSETYEISWRRDGILEEEENEYELTINTPGEYVIQVIEETCGVYRDTTDVNNLNYLIIGDSLLCDDVATDLRAAITPVPPFSSLVTWEIGDLFSSFSTGTAVTVTNNGQYGDFPITIVDQRCPNDSHTENHRWVQQPELNILPRNPQFCYELDSLGLTAVLAGNSDGTYLWQINAVTQENDLVIPSVDTDGNNRQLFPPLSFSPNALYSITAITNDNFNICPPGVDEMLFKPLACVYNIPNVVTPNGDGQNDIFNIEGVEDFPGASLAIFNRWGQEVFSSSAYDEYERINSGWDPEDLPGGVYVYELKLPSIDVVETGNLTIITETGSSGN